MSTIKALMPVVEVEGDLVALELGWGQGIEFGEEVVVETKTRSYPSLFVQGVDTVVASQVGPDLLHLFGLPSVGEFREALSRVYGTGFGPHVPVTIYTLADHAFFEEQDTTPDRFTATYFEHDEHA